MADMTGTLRPIILARVDPDTQINIRPVPGAQAPIRLVFSLNTRPQLQKATGDIESGAVLELDMRWEEMVLLYYHIQQFARTEGLSLPK